MTRKKSAPLAALIFTLLASATVGAANPTPAWVLAPPAAFTQTEKTTDQRGINPCDTPDPGFGSYLPWVSSGQSAYVIVPKGLSQKKYYDVVVHFHGREAARKQWVRSDTNFVMVGLDLGVGSGAYLDHFADPTELPRLLERVREVVRKKSGQPALEQRKLALASWSAGYGATQRAISSSWGATNIDGIILLDGLHTGFRDNDLVTEKLDPFANFASKAARGEKFFFMSHSSIVPPGYASTTTTANYLVWKLGGRPDQKAKSVQKMPMGLEQISYFNRGWFTMRGFSGNGKKDHCAHFGLLDRLVLPALKRRWGT